MSNDNRKTSDWRLYSFVNFYLSDIQRGIQTAHLVSELFTKYTSGKHKKILTEWATSHKTIIVLNGGNSNNLLAVYDNLRSFSESIGDLPVTLFSEDSRSLGGAATATGIIYDINATTNDPWGRLMNPSYGAMDAYLSKFSLA